MADTDIMTHSPVILRPDPSRTVIRPFAPEFPGAFAVEGHSRAEIIVDRVLSLDDAQLCDELARITESLDERHRDVDTILRRRFDEVAKLVGRCGDVGPDRALLIGAYFSEEYSFEAAALFNPSMVLHPDQSNLDPGAIRFVMSLRGIGEGHVSSVTFRTGTWAPGGDVVVDPASPQAVAPRIQKPEKGDHDQVIRLFCGGSREISETVIFPMVPSQKQGIEDLRLVQFTEDDGSTVYIGTYTAFSGSEVQQQLLRGIDFRTVSMRPLQGSIANAKGAALLPRRIDGRFAMLGRQDNESIWLLMSDDIFDWGDAKKLVSPRFPWEFVQMGNCGSPIEIDEGWLVITHGVGMVRNYCMGACLLDKQDPSKVLARTERPIVKPGPNDRDGYVPNVVYSCGGIVYDRTLLLPYGVADSYTTFASVAVDTLLGAMS